MGFTTIPLFLVLAPTLLTPISATLGSSTPLDRGYSQMYNLEFREAHATFQGYVQSHPEDPFGPTSVAAAYLFEEFDRLGILQSELFIDNDKYRYRATPRPDPVVHDQFYAALAQSRKVADAILQKSPRDTRALFAQVLDLGLESDYIALVEGHDLAAVAVKKRAGQAAERLLAIDPSCYDAYVAIGIENYILGLKPAPVRWLLRLYGAETDKELGIQKMKLTAAKGHYLLPLARMLLGVAALRDNDRPTARALLQNLVEAFPKNQLYRSELARLQ